MKMRTICKQYKYNFGVLINTMKDKINQSHRPWQSPKKPWMAKQVWDNMLFLHWPIDPKQIQEQIPVGLQLDISDGCAWIGVVAFTTRHFRARYLPPLPLLSHFTELNVRTYVTLEGKPGVYFFSLNMANLILPLLTRLQFYSNNFYSPGYHTFRSDMIRFNCKGIGSRKNLMFDCEYQPTSDKFLAETGTLEKWLIERYCFYSANSNGSLYRTEILHKPFQLQVAQSTHLKNTFVESDIHPSLLHYVKRNEVLIWNREKLRLT